MARSQFPLRFLWLSCFVFLVPYVQAEPLALPTTAQKPVTDEYHGIKVVDPYRWLESVKDPEVRKWCEKQNRYTRSVLNSYSCLEPVRKRLEFLMEPKIPTTSELTYKGGRFFASQGGVLVTLPFGEKWQIPKTLVDPEAVLSDKTAKMDFFVPSHDGKYVAVSISTEGREEGTLYVFEAATAKKLNEKIPRVTMVTGSLAWKMDGTGFYYTRFFNRNGDSDHPRDYYQQVYFHKLGTDPKDDTYALGKEFDRIDAASLMASEDGKYILAAVAHGTGSNLALFLLGSEGKWNAITRYDDKVIDAAFGLDGTIYVLSRCNAPRGRILRMPLGNLDVAKAEEVVPQGGGVLTSVLPTISRVFVFELADCSARIRVFDRGGKELNPIPVGRNVWIGEALRLRGDEILFRTESFLEPPTWYRHDGASGETTKTALVAQYKADFEDMEMIRAFPLSKDGTRVPLSIIRNKGTKLDGRNPTLLTGYGGYGESQTASFEINRRIWLEQGGVYAVAHLRGSGEYGENWHMAGRGTKKQNVFDDFAACAQFLIDQKYTNPDKLAIMGASHGGLVMGAALTQHARLFQAVVAEVGFYDMLRQEEFQGGPENVPEFGSVQDKEQFQVLHQYSPYHRVVERTAYPAVFLIAGANDPRVHPADSWKMAARLQAATSSQRPILLWTNFNSGHGASTPEEQAQTDADIYAFLFQQLEVKYTPVVN